MNCPECLQKTNSNPCENCEFNCAKCPHCNKMKIDQSCYSDGLDWLHCLECGWIDPTTQKPEIIGDWN